jgi:hypothetical protein
MGCRDNKGRFIKGAKGNPKGKPPLPDVIKDMTRETKPAIIEAYYKISNLSPEKVDDYKPKTMLEKGILKTVKEFTRNGKTDQIRHIWAECHGKPKETQEHTGKIEKHITVNYVKHTD